MNEQVDASESGSGRSDVSSSPARILVGVCTLNEADNIGPLLLALRKAMPTADLVVIDDNSSDETGRRVRSVAANDPAIELVVRQERGLGGAIRHAMQLAVEGGYDWFINLDGDFSHDPNQVPKLYRRALDAPPVDVVIGSRYIDGGSIVGWPIHRTLMSRTVNRFATMCLRLPVSDCSGSMRCYRVSSLRRIDVGTLRSNGYAVLEEILVRLDRNQAAMAEVPITFTDRTRGQSKLTLVEAMRSTCQMLAMAVRT